MVIAWLLACAQPAAVVLEETDPSEAMESGTSACFADEDGDGYGDPSAPQACASGAVPSDADCDDADAGVNPDAAEVCSGSGVARDDDCDGLIDGDDPSLVDGVPLYADEDGDGYGSDEIVTVCGPTDGAATIGGDCDDTDPDIHPAAEEDCSEVDRDCDGTTADAQGATEGCAAESCLAILEAAPGASDGAYWLEFSEGAAQIWCDMDDGGWTLGFLRNTASTASQPDFGAEDTETDALGTSADDASASAAPILAGLDLNARDWTELRLSAHSQGGRTYTSDTIPREALRIAFGEDGYLLYGGDTGYYWCGGAAAYTDNGAGATSNPDGAPDDCKGHGSLGSGWDFSQSTSGNAGLTLCGGDGSSFLSATWGGTWTYYGAAGGAQAIWVR